MEGFYLLFLIPGSIFLTMGLIFLFLMRKVTKPAKDWKLTTGIIIQKEKNYTISIGNFFNKGDFVSTQPDSAPTFQYEVNGIQYEKTSKIEQSPGFSIGSTVEILYDPEEPEQAVINTLIQKGTLINLISKILTLFGLILLIIALFIILI